MTAALSIQVNGTPGQHIAVVDRGLLYGDGLFETIAVRNGAPQFLGQHLQRLFSSCQRLQLVVDQSLFRQEITAFLAQQTVATYVLKLIVTRGEGGRGYRPPDSGNATRIIMAYPFPDYPPQYRTHGVCVRLCSTRLGRNPVLAGLKHLNRLEQVMARLEWHDGQIAEGLMVDEFGNVIEGTMSNLFWVIGNRLLTSSVENAGIDGVMRRMIMRQVCPALHKVCEVTEVDVAGLQAADEVFITNSLIGVWPVIRLENRQWEVGTITRAIQHELAKVNE